MKLSFYWLYFFSEFGNSSHLLRSSATFLYCWQQFDTVALAKRSKPNICVAIISGMLVFSMIATYFIWLDFQAMHYVDLTKLQFGAASEMGHKANITGAVLYFFVTSMLIGSNLYLFGTVRSLE